MNCGTGIETEALLSCFFNNQISNIQYLNWLNNKHFEGHDLGHQVIDEDASKSKEAEADETTSNNHWMTDDRGRCYATAVNCHDPNDLSCSRFMIGVYDFDCLHCV